MQFSIKFFILVTLFLFSAKSFSQDYSSVDAIVDNYPNSGISLDAVAHFIQNDFSKEDEKARAVFRWVTTKISFDVALAEKMDYTSLNAFSYTTEAEKRVKEKKFKETLLAQTFTSRKTVCHGYAVLVEYLCEKLNLETKVITGTLKGSPSEIGKLPTIVNHAWNAVKVNGEWKFMDTTLGAGFVSSNSGLFKFDFNEGYFFTKPELFFFNHYPLNEKWLLVAKTKNDFAKSPFYFSNYIKYNYQIEGPKSGIYSKKQANFTFTVEGIDEYDTVQYALSSGNHQKIVLQSDNIKDYVIDLSTSSDDYLSLLINDRVMVVYKIVN